MEPCQIILITVLFFYTLLITFTIQFLIREYNKESTQEFYFKRKIKVNRRAFRKYQRLVFKYEFYLNKLNKKQNRKLFDYKNWSLSLIIRNVSKNIKNICFLIFDLLCIITLFVGLRAKCFFFKFHRSLRNVFVVKSVRILIWTSKTKH